MTRSIQHSEENRVRNYSVLRLNVRSLFIATAIASGIAYLVYVLFLTVAPQATMTLFSYHLQAASQNSVLSLSIF
ncbi:hypothetical protein [Microcoleus sp. herbarium14]|uniref:hypothetical protein n=1 Tax=Microcoleus sp. herbarium14 TaxID=3055439 RepID=UPI002FD35294